MNCSQAEELICRMDSGELAPESARGLEAHCRLCPGCGQALARMAAENAALAGLREAPPPAGLDQAVLERLREDLSPALAVPDLAFALALLMLPAALLLVWQFLSGQHLLDTFHPSLDSVRQALPERMLQAADDAGQSLYRFQAFLRKLPGAARILGLLLGMFLTLGSSMLPAAKLKEGRDL
jgi:hypothetical protein